MPITSTKPIEVDGIEYPYFMINLAISPLVKPTDIGASVAMRLTPYRVLEDGSSVSLPDNSIPITYMDVFESGDWLSRRTAGVKFTKVIEWLCARGYNRNGVDMWTSVA